MQMPVNRFTVLTDFWPFFPGWVTIAPFKTSQLPVVEKDVAEGKSRGAARPPRFARGTGAQCRGLSSLLCVTVPSSFPGC